jgi:hypothetical protein
MNDNEKHVIIKMNKQLHHSAKLMAAKQGIPMRHWIGIAIAQKLIRDEEYFKKERDEREQRIGKIQ